MISTVTLRPYLSFAAFAATATVLRATAAPRSTLFYEQVISPELFEPAVYAFTIFLGLVLIATTPRPTRIREFVSRIESRAFSSFSATAGAIAGWGIATSALHFIAGGSSALAPALVVGSYAVLFTLGPLWAFETVAPIVREFTNLRFKERRGLAAIQTAGWFLSAYGSWNLWLWITHS